MRKVAALRERRAEAKKTKGFSVTRVAQTVGSVIAGFGLTAAAGKPLTLVEIYIIHRPLVVGGNEWMNRESNESAFFLSSSLT